MPGFDPTTWIDEQRRGVRERANVFNDILAACDAYRRRDVRVPADLTRTQRVESIKLEAARFDSHIDDARRAPCFDDLVKRWKAPIAPH